MAGHRLANPLLILPRNTLFGSHDDSREDNDMQYIRYIWAEQIIYACTARTRRFK